jgi:PAS domain S-box-containing protein
MNTTNEPIDYKYKFNECDARFEAVFNLTSAASKIINDKLEILKVNEALIKLLGYTTDEIVGTQIMDYACEEDIPHWQALQKAMWQDGKPDFKLDACLRKKDGTLAWVHVTTVRFEENDIAYAYTILDDFTAQKKLQESEQRLSMALKYSKMAVVELNLTNRAIIHSEGFDELLGYPSGTRWTEESLIGVFSPEYAEQLRQLLTAIGPGQNFDFQGCIKTPDGVTKWVNFQGRAEAATGSRIERLLGTLYDITRDKLAEREKDDFISIASHELKTPLTALRGSLQLLERMKGVPTAAWPVLIEQAARSMGKVTVLVDELLNASRMNEGQLHLKKTRFNLTKAIEECCLHITVGGVYQITQQGIRDMEIVADSERIQRVIVNLVNNAVKYAPQSKEIVIRVESINEYAKISVTDRGPGIDPEKTAHLFERYYRADQHGGQYSGLGLGLYISAEIIKKHGGRIGVQSAPGEGSTFWFTLPAN